jgi:DNA-binding XRE family transcriptional regulator
VKKVTFCYNFNIPIKENIMDIREKVGKKAKELRNKLGVSQENLVDMVELNRTYIKLLTFN